MNLNSTPKIAPKGPKIAKKAPNLGESKQKDAAAFPNPKFIVYIGRFQNCF